MPQLYLLIIIMFAVIAVICFKKIRKSKAFDAFVQDLQSPPIPDVQTAKDRMAIIEKQRKELSKNAKANAKQIGILAIEQAEIEQYLNDNDNTQKDEKGGATE